MNEVQFISDLIIDMINGLSGYSPAKLDKFYKNYDDSFDKGEEISKALDKLFNILLQLEPSAIKDTIFNRPPLFFSLLIVLYNHKGEYNIKKIESGLLEIDAHYNQDNKSPEDIDFIGSVSATTQGEKQRKIRDNYIKQFIL